ncbi:SMC-Scp complex subunit ScpB [Ammoniphilus oxalaticus]|uniref:Segregation and condensation protein B n=1 Tax=Ammoniphilus oxalaticus TaxID=66863 RepID=A0A419SMY3_9BACL|nr:SMC-Scp complex subunit ScpB [Ammoniphilus oxalaticus]RKD25658.1 SMC-Scp complex subunit ScpB [Ammoniphilus oxalaticus]
MTRDELKRVIEGCIFVSGSEGIDAPALAETLDIDPQTALELVYELQQQFKDEQRGLQIIELGGTFQLTTRLEHAPYFEKLAIAASRAGLTQAALETLAIIAYKQPITRAEIEDIRGVRSEKSIQTLISRGLAQEQGRAEVIGRPILYGTTREFMEYFGLKQLDDLPPLPSYTLDTELENEVEFLFQKLQNET